MNSLNGRHSISLALCDRSFAMYVRLTWFHVAMYFSMQSVTHVDSEDESDVPGFAMHFSKHENLMACMSASD
jgi:hypothetical protein